jgi:hypothetical protein
MCKHFESNLLRFCAMGFLMSGLASVSRAVDGVVLIDQARALAGNVTPGDTPGFPVTISQPGSYRLAGNLTVSTTCVSICNSGIFIQADDVTLDLNGFTITGSADYGIYGALQPSGSGTKVPSGVFVMNGTVRNFNLYGILLGSRCHIEKVHALSNGRDGLNCSTGSLITGNRVAGNATDSAGTFSGIFAGADSTVSNNVVANNHGNGVAVGGGLVIDNVIYGNTGAGINGFNVGSTGYARNVLRSNGGGVNVIFAVSLANNLCDGVLCP